MTLISTDRLVSIYSWVRSTRISIYFGFDLHKIPISNCPLFDLHEFWSAQFSICTVFALQFLDLQRFRSAQYSICTDFDLHGFRSTCISICKSIFDLWIFRSANQISIYRFFDLQFKFRSTDFSICKSNFDLLIENVSYGDNGLFLELFYFWVRIFVSIIKFINNLRDN